MIKDINSEKYVRFLRGNQAEKNQVSINEKGQHYGYFEDDKLVAVVSKNETKNTIRIKGFMVNQYHCGKGIGTKLLEHLLDDTKDMTAFTTIYSRKLFEKAGFELINEKSNNIAFMKRKAKSKRPERTLDDDIKEKMNPAIIELSKIILPLDKEDRKLAIEYIYSSIKKIK